VLHNFSDGTVANDGAAHADIDNNYLTHTLSGTTPERLN